MYDWQVHIEREWSHPDLAKLIVFRHAPNGRLDVQTGWSAADPRDPIFTVFDEGAQIVGDVGLRLPYSALQAIAEMLKPGPAQGEVAALKEALVLERERVDRLLGHAIIAT